jgi:hypothetical protein
MIDLQTLLGLMLAATVVIWEACFYLIRRGSQAWGQRK